MTNSNEKLTETATAAAPGLDMAALFGAQPETPLEKQFQKFRLMMLLRRICHR